MPGKRNHIPDSEEDEPSPPSSKRQPPNPPPYGKPLSTWTDEEADAAMQHEQRLREASLADGTNYSNGFGRLPVEIMWAHIAPHLDVKTALAMSRTNGDNNETMDEAWYRLPDLQHPQSSSAFLALVARMQRVAPHTVAHIKKLDLSHVDIDRATGHVALTARQLGAMLRACPELTELSLAGCVSVTQEGIAEVARTCAPRLTTLNLEMTDGTYNPANNRYSSAALVALARNLTVIDTLNLGESRMNDVMLRKFAEALPAPTLRVLTLNPGMFRNNNGTGTFGDTAMSHFLSAAGCRNLEEVDLYNSYVGLHTAVALANLPHLRTVAVDFSLQFSSPPREAIDATNHAVAQLAASRSIEYIHFCGSHVTDVSAFKNHPTLRGMAFRDNVNAETINGLSPLLTTIDISNAKVTKKALRQLPVACPQLEKIDAGSCSAVSNDAVHHIIANCHRLQQLNLSDCKGLTGDLIASLSAIVTPDIVRNLKWLNFENCDGIPPEALPSLKSLLPNTTIIASNGAEVKAAAPITLVAATTVTHPSAAVLPTPGSSLSATNVGR